MQCYWSWRHTGKTIRLKSYLVKHLYCHMKLDVWMHSIDSNYSKITSNKLNLQLVRKREHHQKRCIENECASQSKIIHLQNFNKSFLIFLFFFTMFIFPQPFCASISAKRYKLFASTFIIISYAKITAYKSFVWYNFHMICRCRFKGFSLGVVSQTHKLVLDMWLNNALENWKKMKWKEENAWYYSMWIQIEL